MKKNRAPKSASPAEPAQAKAAKPKKKRAPVCEQRGCRKPAVSHGYCRLHYLANWREIKEEDKLRAERRLNAYVDRLSKRYPADYLEKIKAGIEDEGMFKQTMEQLEMDQDEDSETEREYLEKMSRTFKPED